MPPGRDGEDMAVEQLVLLKECRDRVISLAHSIPLTGHLGRDKTTQHILQRFYWPTIYRDVVEYCRTRGWPTQDSICDALQAISVQCYAIWSPRCSGNISTING